MEVNSASSILTHHHFQVRSSVLHVKLLNRVTPHLFVFEGETSNFIERIEPLSLIEAPCSLWARSGLDHHWNHPRRHSISWAQDPPSPLGAPCVSCGALQRLLNCFNLCKVHIVCRRGPLGHSLGCKGTLAITQNGGSCKF